MSVVNKTTRWKNDPLPKPKGPPTLKVPGSVHDPYNDPFSPDNEGRPGHWETSIEINYFLGAVFGGDPQEPSKLSFEKPPNPYPGCITANWFVNTPEMKKVFNDYWQLTQQSGKENGGWFFFETKTNTLIGRTDSEGEKAGMPKEQDEFDAQMRQFQQSGQSVIFMFQFHTHPGGSGPGTTDQGNISNTTKRAVSQHNPIGIVISGPGKLFFYDEIGLLRAGHPRLNECL
jgi:hypothetical protein